MEYYTDKIQLDLAVIHDIFGQITASTKMLVFGLGHDSRMWHEGTRGNTFFIEHNPYWIRLNHDIPAHHIVHYSYPTEVRTSQELTPENLERYPVPTTIKENGPYDIILIDGPPGYDGECPGRILPCFWSSRDLSHEGTLLYIDDSRRPLEKYCVDKFFKSKVIFVFPERDGCTKIRM